MFYNTELSTEHFLVKVHHMDEERLCGMPSR